MIAGRIAGPEGSVIELGKPPDWDDSKGHCGALAVCLRPLEGQPGMVEAFRVELTPQGYQMVSAWLPNEDELARLQAGAPVHLGIVGTMHPPVHLNVGDVPEGADIVVVPEEVARDIADRVLREVCELPDRTSPEGQPEMLLVTVDELHGIVEDACRLARRKA